jgi:hypothetical protein
MHIVQIWFCLLLILSQGAHQPHCMPQCSHNFWSLYYMTIAQHASSIRVPILLHSCIKLLIHLGEYHM